MGGCGGTCNNGTWTAISNGCSCGLC
jgi:hypothetical protein